jgi:hypothetical protein
VSQAEAFTRHLPGIYQTFGKTINGEMRCPILSGQLQTTCTTWFEQPIPPKCAVLNRPPSDLLRDL